jgi:two-component system, LytTR family, sensor kinase
MLSKSVSLPLQLSIKMKKSKSYAPYLFAAFWPGFASISHSLLSKPGLVVFWIAGFFVILGLWRLVEWLLSRSEKRLVRLGSVLLGSIFYSFVVLYLDYYAFHLLLTFTGFKPFEAGVHIFSIVVISAILLESVKWAKEREKAKIENLRLQSENIESKYKLLREQVNPQFLFQCLKTLRMMLRSDDPQAEGYVLKLADVYRQTLKKDKNIVSVQEELALLRTYMFLMRYGRENTISLEIDVSEASFKARMPIFALQLLCDNCIKHNVFSESHPLYIHLFQKNAESITMLHNHQPKGILESGAVDMEHLEMRYALEGIKNGVLIEQNESTYSTTIKLFH